MESRSSSKIISALSNVSHTTGKYVSAYAEHLYYKAVDTLKEDSQTAYLIALFMLAGATAGYVAIKSDESDLQVSLGEESENLMTQFAEAAFATVKSTCSLGKSIGASFLGGALVGLFGAGVATTVKDFQEVNERVKGRRKKRC